MGTATPHGLAVLATQLFFPNPGAAADFAQQALEIENQFDSVVSGFAPAAGLDVNSESDGPALAKVMLEHEDEPEFWAWWAGKFSAVRRDATERGDIEVAVWATAVAERARAMWAYRTSVETAVRMGHSARRILNVLNTWQAQKGNSDEQFWQEEFKQQQFVLSLAFGVPIVLVEDQAYVGGMDLSRRGASLVDYLFTVEGSRQAILVEIKTPTTRLVAKKAYRGRVYAPSRELSGAVSQVLSYRTTLMKRIETKRTTDGSTLGSQLPRCVVVAGNSAQEFDGRSDVSESFETYRGSLREVEIITYDELFRKVGQAAQLFGLVVDQKPSTEPAEPAPTTPN